MTENDFSQLEEISPEKIKNLDIQGLQALCNDIYQYILVSTSRTGGHTGTNLGAIEMTVGLHYNFNSPEDKFIWDTGHQGYTHKILTGRATDFESLNEFRGMSRFIFRGESEHDIMDASHAGTSISTGLGLAISNKLNKRENWVISIIGDGSLCEGLALEALNHASAEDDVKYMIALNDNGYAISEGFGALHNHFMSIKNKETEKENFFTSLGYRYYGPIDGHDIDSVVNTIKTAKEEFDGRIPLLHFVTVKGNKYKPADSHVYRFHFSFPFNIETGETKSDFSYVGYHNKASDIIHKKMSENDDIITITPSTIYATGLQKCFDDFPERCFDPGMEEQHAMSLAAGFGLSGKRTIIFYQSTFMQRAFDQIIHDVAFMDLPVMILASRSGFAGYDNPTHHGIYDLTYLRSIPNLRIMYPKDNNELERMISDNLDNLKSPLAILMPYGPYDDYSSDYNIWEETVEEFGKPEVITEGDDILVLTVGNKFSTAREISESLQSKGLSVGLVNIRYLVPLPDELKEIISKYNRVITIEEYILDGGFGMSVAAFILDHDLNVKLLRFGMDKIFAEPGSNQELTEYYKLDSSSILEKISANWEL